MASNSTQDPTRPPDTDAPTHGWWKRLGLRLGIRQSASERDALRLPPMTRGMRSFSMAVFFVLGAGVMWFVITNPFDVAFLPGRPSQSAVAQRDAAPAAQPVFQCPMHPEVVQSEPGDCPICGMDLVEVRPAGTDTGPVTGDSGRADEVYQCPMHPEVVQDTPGACPICGMDLVQVREGRAAGGAGGSSIGAKHVSQHAAEENAAVEAGVIRIDPVQVQNIGVVSATAESADIARQSRTVGILDFNADSITWINVKFEGWIEKVYVNYVGEEVEKGQPLFEIYSPELVTTQEEYIRALDYRASFEGSSRPGARKQAESLVRSTRDRMAYWDITDEQIRHLEASRQVQRNLTVFSPADGVVVEVMSEALEGMFVKPGMDLYKIADLSTVWVHADIYELDIPWIRKEQPALVSFRNSPQEQFRGRVLFLYPEVSRDTRTLKICVEVPNPQRRLRPGMYADVIVQGPPVQDAIVVPQSAVIRSGERNIVFVDLGEGRFEPRDVDLGVKGEGDRIQILSGVAAGEDVVTQAQFMLDSESRLREAIAQYRERLKHERPTTAPTPPPEHVH